MKKKYVKCIALAMILCVGFFIGCKDDLPDGWHTIEISGEYLESEGAVGIYVDVPENVPYVYVTRYDSIGPDNYITYQMPSYRVNPEDGYLTQQLLSPGKHTIKDPYVNAGKSYKYCVEFYSESDVYESQDITVTVPAESNKNDDFANANAVGFQVEWDKITHTFSWKLPPNCTNIPENVDADSGLPYTWDLRLDYGEFEEFDAPPASAFYSVDSPHNAYQEILQKDKLGQTYNINQIELSMVFNQNSDNHNLDITKPFCTYQYAKKLDLSVGTYPQSVTFPTEAEYLSQFVGEWVQPDLTVTTLKADRSYTSTSSNNKVNSGTYFFGETNGSCCVKLNETYGSNVVYDMQFDKDTLYVYDENIYLVKKQNEDIDISSCNCIVVAGNDLHDQISYYIGSNNSVEIWFSGNSLIAEYKLEGSYEVNGNTITIKATNEDDVECYYFRGVVSSEFDIYCTYLTYDGNEYIGEAYF